ncbi:MAG: response regulator transcription factor [Nitrosomonadales bacterium]|nr:response regulator transcription factor [Nitrosomonadales bacterium]
MTAGCKPIRVMLVDDHPVVCDGYRRLLETEPDIRVVAEAGNGETGFSQYKKHAPDVVVLDLSMPGIGGLETIRRIKAHDPRAHILVFSMHNSETMVSHALQAGATGYLTKQSGMGQMIQAVRQVARGERFIDAEYTGGAASRSVPATPENPLQALTSREFQLFKLMAEGYSISEIAATLCISPKTVGVHHTNIMKKLGLQNASQIVRLAIRCNVIEP